MSSGILLCSQRNKQVNTPEENVAKCEKVQSGEGLLQWLEWAFLKKIYLSLDMEEIKNKS